jgi:hypothetical protein
LLISTTFSPTSEAKGRRSGDRAAGLGDQINTIS